MTDARSTPASALTLFPDLGDLYRLNPQFNAGTVVELLRAMHVREVLWASDTDPDHPLRDALPAAGIAIREGFSQDWAWADAEHGELQSYLNQYPQGRERMRDAARAEAAFAEDLGVPVTAARIPALLDAARTYHAALKDRLDEGPGTRWQARRLDELTARLQGETGVVIAALDDLPGLLDRLNGATLADLGATTPGELSRVRALADRAWQLRDEDDLTALLDALTRETGDPVTPKAELDAAAAGIYLAVGELAPARELLERAAHALTDDLPRSLPGLVLARLGQVRDAQGDRELAVRTYRAVQALAHAPQIARDTAELGLQTPFTLELPGPEDEQ